MSDLEGRWDRLVSFCTDNPGIALHGDDLVLADGWSFVFGGDAFDRGPGSLRLVRALVGAADRWPDRVVLLAGNRDLNKLRLPRELGRSPRAADLRHIFERTMGAPNAFEHRRAELGAVDDDAVVRSFVADVAPDGAVRQYLARARMTWRIDDTFFVHGGIPDGAWLRLGDGAPCGDFETWRGLLERFLADQLARFDADPYGDLADPPAWWPIIAYQMPRLPTRTNEASIIYGRTVFDGNNPALPSPEVRHGLLAEGLPFLVVGHTPNGDTPSFVRDDAEFVLTVADASYPRSSVCPQLWHDGRGLRARGRVGLDDGRELALEADLRSDARIGRWSEGWLDKGELETGERLRFHFDGGTRFAQVAGR